MSDPTPATTPPTAPKPKSRLVPVIAGTAFLALGAVAYFQFFSARPAASQTNQQQPASRPASANGNVVAKVTGQAITYEEVARECYNRHGAEVLDTLVNRLMIQQACAQRNITVTKAEVEQEVVDIAKKFNLPLDTWYSMLEAERGLNREQYHADIIWPMIALKKLAGKEVQVTEQDMQVGFERDYGPRVKARLILVQGNVRQANSIWEQCQAKPDEFDRIAREFSADPNSRPLGGVFPPIRRHGGSKALEDAAFKLKVGEISPVVQLEQNQYVILKCEGLTEPVVTDIKVVWNDLYNQLVEEKTQQSVAEVFKGLEERAQVTNYLTRQTTGPQTIRQVSAESAAPTAGPTANAPGTTTLK
ncbi:MAG: peptidylprolyl isomerase [Planctomycetaceae bacterium]|nr:peptidylprolyl isomerase [Planctomycetaceae bacterium]